MKDIIETLTSNMTPEDREAFQDLQRRFKSAMAEYDMAKRGGTGDAAWANSVRVRIRSLSRQIQAMVERTQGSDVSS